VKECLDTYGIQNFDADFGNFISKKRHEYKRINDERKLSNVIVCGSLMGSCALIYWAFPSLLPVGIGLGICVYFYKPTIDYVAYTIKNKVRQVYKMLSNILIV